ncbi:MAG TPA: hypothetical protein VHQ45_03025 [Gemmatimonadaceae bacterium]|jgi:hypothetical protein|nr:hypothetical protein [Gemmatimonadaceae bacterium]
MRAFPFLAGFIGILCLAPTASAQRMAEVRRVVWLDSVAVAPPFSQQVAQVVQPSRKRYVWGGAAIGAGVTALVVALSIRNDGEGCLGCHPLMFVPAAAVVVAGGGLVGALGGFVVHGWVAEQRDQRVALGLAIGR